MLGMFILDKSLLFANDIPFKERRDMLCRCRSSIFIG
jgi:hypothetical protein